MFQTILLAFDGSDHAKSALKTAAALSKTFNAALHVVHTPQVDTPPILIGSYVSLVEAPPTQEQIEEAGELIADMARNLAEEQGVTVEEVHLCSAGPSQDILATAEKTGADLIVMGRRGLGALGALTLGSVSLSVSRGATCACLTVV